MSDEGSSAQAGSKKRRLQGACDLCRQKKIKCDSAQKADHKCSNCVAFNSDCTHVAALSKKPGRWHKGHISSVPIAPKEDIQVHIKSILSATTPYVVPKDQTIIRAVLVDLARYARALEAEIVSLKAVATAPTIPHTDSDSNLDENSIHRTNPLRFPSVNENFNRHYGKASYILLVKSAMDVRKLVFPLRAPESSSTFRREEHWSVFPWQRLQRQPDPPLHFPPADLLDSLVETFVECQNVFLGIVHAPSFRREIAAGTHHISQDFGNLVLCICAVASRYSDDPRVKPGHQAGWEWYLQVRLPRPNEFLKPPTLWEVQVYPLMAMFLFGSTTPEPGWNLISAGLRLCQDVGAHRKRVMKPETWTAEDELWKRCFWVHMTFDVFVSSVTGRPRTITAEHYDADYPLQVDDEYWPGEPLADTKTPWRQPPTLPSKAVSLVLLLELLEILGFAQNLIYAVKRPSLWDTMCAPDWGSGLVVHLDSALNKWVDSIPEHLRWADYNPNESHFNQSTMLYIVYFWVQQHLHRPFMPRISPGQPDCSRASLARGYPSIVICGNAARFCSHVLSTHSKRGAIPSPIMLTAVFQSAVLIILMSWGGKRLGLVRNPAKHAEDLQKCLDVLALYEGRYQTAGRYHDILRELLKTGLDPNSDLVDSPDYSRKRTHEEADIGSQDTGGRAMPAPIVQPFDMTWDVPLHSDDLASGWNFAPDVDAGPLNEFMNALLMTDGLSDVHASWFEGVDQTFNAAAYNDMPGSNVAGLGQI